MFDPSLWIFAASHFILEYTLYPTGFISIIFHVARNYQIGFYPLCVYCRFGIILALFFNSFQHQTIEYMVEV
jgi:hypothetical protein